MALVEYSQAAVVAFNGTQRLAAFGANKSAFYCKLIFKTYIQNLDNDILDAARIDGCGEFRIFLRILLPIIKPALATVTIFTFMANWNEFLLAVIFLQDKKLHTLPLGMAVFVGQYSAPWQLIGSGVVISILPVLLLFFILQNQFIRGLTAGALK